MDRDQKLFAFKLAVKKQKTDDGGKWKARDGMPIAACTQVPGYPPGVHAQEHFIYGADRGWFC